MTQHDLTDAQWCFLDLLMRAKDKGVDRINRQELLRADYLPLHLRMKVVWAGLELASTELVNMPTEHDFEITDAGAQLYSLRFDGAAPTTVADLALALESEGSPS